MDGSHINTDYPVVLRFAGLYPHQLAGCEAHRMRKGGDLGHVDQARSMLNRRLIGDDDWAAQALTEIREMTAENLAAELELLEKRKRRKDIKRRMVEGPKQLWRPTRHGPMREVILTANSEWFDADLGGFFGEDENAREKAFEARAVEWLRENFGADVIHARADRDEAAYHIHAVIMPRATVEIAKPNAKTKVASATRRMLQPSIHPLIEDYEAAQDSVGAWFSEIGLTRGEERARAIREARAAGQEPPKRRYHARTAQWRAAEEQRLTAERAALAEQSAAVEDREAEAETVLAVAEGIGTGALTIDDTGAAPAVATATGPDTPPDADPDRLAALKRRSPTGMARAAAAFGAAWRRLTGRAEVEAEARAQAGVAEAVAERAAIARARRALSGRIAGLRRWLGGSAEPGRRSDDGPREDGGG